MITPPLPGCGVDAARRGDPPGLAVAVIARAQEAAHGVLDRPRHLHRERVSRHLGRPPVRFEEGDALPALAQVTLELPPFFLGQRAVEVVETEVHQLVAVERVGSVFTAHRSPAAENLPNYSS